MRVAILASALLSIFLFSCSSTGDTQAKKQPVPLQALQQEWQLITVDNRSIEAQSTLKVDEQGRATGRLACNNFFGTLQLEGSQLRINKMGSTRKQCRPPLNAVEITVGSTLSNFSEVTIIKQQLILKSAKHTLVYHIK